MKIRCYMIVALLLMTKGIWGNNVVVVDGITNGTISANSSTASKDATVTLTVEPSEGYYITANDITIIKTGGGNMAQTRNDPNIADIIHPNASSIDAEGKGTYTFTMPVSDVKIEAVFRVRETVTGATVNLSASSFTYNGNTQAPSVTSVTKGDITYLASESTNGFADYDVSIPNSINATESPFTVNVTFRGKYTGTASADYTINQATISHVDIAAISDQTYTGSPLTPEPVVKDLDISTTPLIKGKDYTVSYADDHTNVSDAVTVTITGMGNYDNNTTASTTFKIIAATLDATTLNNKIVLSSTSFEYTGEAQAPTVTIEGMTEGTDYTVKYKKGNEQATSEKPKDAGTYTIVVVGKGNFSGEVTTNKTFIIEQPKAGIIDNSKPVTVDGETFYNLTEENAEVIDNTIQVDIALPSEADTRTTITTTGFLIFSTGTDLNMAIRNLKLHNIVIFIFTGDLYGDSSKLRLKGSATRDTRAIGDLKLTSGAEYEVISEGDMILTMKLGEEETAFTSISVRASSTNINAVEADNSTDKWYDLNGKRINEPTHKGLYIRNGKKVVIK